jgi:VTC domain-containing protein
MLDGKVFQRFEAKYVITELEAAQITHFMEPYVVPDPHAREYPINSLYLDSLDLRLFDSSEAGEKNRFKLRIRSYTSNPEDPVFLEIKRRTNQIISKERARVTRESLWRVLDPRQTLVEGLVSGDSKESKALFQFRDHMAGIAAAPRVAVRYMREAYVSDLEEPVRITFDRHLACLPCLSYTSSVWDLSSSKWKDVFEFPIILEIKFTNRFPFWVRRIIERFELRRTSVAKYVVCVKTLQREGIPVEGESLESLAT